MATLYFHIPFCKRICSYCDFYRVGAIELLPKVVEQMHNELNNRSNYLKNKQITSIYFGGGTPSLVSPEHIEQLINRARELFDCTHLSEITIEANPDDLSEEYVAELARTSVNRVSLGIQSFDNDALKLMNRRHSAEEAEDAVRRLRRAGIANISIDIIFGIAGYGGNSLERTLQRAIALDVEHISAYHLTIEERTHLGIMTRKGEYTPIPEELSEQEFIAVHKAFTDAGYEHYEVSNYAKPNYRAKHNSAYWQGVEYLGIGAGAHSFSGDNRTWCISTAREYSEGIFKYEGETLAREDHLNEYIMTSLRRTEGIDLNHIEINFGTEQYRRILRSADKWIADKTLILNNNRLSIPAERFLISDAVIEDLFL